jgi:predicted hydrolase (HD superfamily)
VHKFGKSGAELEMWQSAGLLHDFDYERFPETHPLQGADELRKRATRRSCAGSAWAMATIPACRARATWRGHGLRLR